MITSQPVDPLELFRMFVPRYASTPLSGAAAAWPGGRFNRVGVEALYLSLESAMALGEYQQSSPHLLPATICSYTASLPPLVDLGRLDESVWDPI